jgi:hypothetical protein
MTKVQYTKKARSDALNHPQHAELISEKPAPARPAAAKNAIPPKAAATHPTTQQAAVFQRPA